MMGELLQDGVVTLVAVAAAGLVLRRVFAFVRPSASAPACDRCASGRHAVQARNPQALIQIVRRARSRRA